MNRTFSLAFVAACISLASFAEDASAQYSGRNARSISSATRNMLFNRPSVSPYVNLATRSASGGLPNYHTYVRPQLEQQQQQVAQQQRSAQVQRQISDIQNSYRQQQAQVQGQLTTGKVGWSSRGFPRFGTTLNYYPGFSAARRR